MTSLSFASKISSIVSEYIKEGGNLSNAKLMLSHVIVIENCDPHIDDQASKLDVWGMPDLSTEELNQALREVSFSWRSPISER